MVCFPELSTLRASTETKNITRSSYHQQILLNHFWLRWKKEYILRLKSVHELKGCTSSGIKIQDLVLLEDRCPNAQWKAHRVTELFHGQHGAVRAGTLLLAERKLLTRPIQKVYQLKVSLGYPSSSCRSWAGDDVMNKRNQKRRRKEMILRTKRGRMGTCLIQ